MDDALLRLIEEAADVSSGEQANVRVRIIDIASGIVEVERPGSPRHQLRALPDLYGPGVGGTTVDPKDERYEPLLRAIEQTIVEFSEIDAALTDSRVLLALNTLSSSPETDPAGDELLQRIQVELRLFLSLNDHSRAEVRAALRKVAKSVQRHTRLAGPRGYLSFVRPFFGK